MYQERREEADLSALKTALMTRGQHRKTLRRTDYSHQKRDRQHDRQQNDNK